MTEPLDLKLLNVELTHAMTRNLVEIAKLIGPRTRFGPMLSEFGAVETLKRLRLGETSGFTDLWRIGRLDLTLEALVCDNQKYHPLFSSTDLMEMRQALKGLGYRGRTS